MIVLQYSEHNVSMDKDTIVHTVKSTNGKFHCQVYRLFGCHHRDEPGSAHKPDFSENTTGVTDTDPPRSPRRQRRRRPQRWSVAFITSVGSRTALQANQGPRRNPPLPWQVSSTWPGHHELTGWEMTPVTKLAGTCGHFSKDLPH